MILAYRLREWFTCQNEISRILFVVLPTDAYRCKLAVPTINIIVLDYLCFGCSAYRSIEYVFQPQVNDVA